MRRQEFRRDDRESRNTRWVPAFADTTEEIAGTVSVIPAKSPDQISFDGHQKQIENMILAVRENKSLAVDGMQARNAVAFVQALYESAEQGRPVKL